MSFLAPHYKGNTAGGGGGGVSDHGALSGLGDDDHTQYILADGSRDFSGVVVGVTPTLATHLATKGYVDGAIVTDHGGLSGLGDDDHTQYSLADGTRDFTGVVVGVTPTLASHLATKGYVDGEVISDHGGLSGLGDDDHTIYSLADGTRAFTGVVVGVTPVLATHLATKGYVDGEVISDHGGLSGLGDDDHTQYSLADGTRAFSGTVSGVDPTLAAHLATKNYVDSTVVTDHGGLSGLGDDDHTQYSLADGTRDFTGVVVGVTPTLSTHLATKGYVDGLGGNFSGLTNGSIVFVASGAASEDNDELFWDNTNKVAVIGDNDGSDLEAIIAGADSQYENNFIVRNETLLGIEGTFLRYDNTTPAAKANFLLGRSRGTIASPLTISAGDDLGGVLACGWDGTDWVQVAEVGFKSGAETNSGRIKLRTSNAGTFDNVFGCHEDGYTIVGDVDSHSLNLVSGANSLAVIDDFEVQGQSRFEDTIGWQTAPESTSAIVAEYTSSAINQFLRIDKKYNKTAGAPPAAGVNVLSFTLEDGDGSTSGGINNLTARAVRHSVAYNRTGSHPTTNTQYCVHVVGFGPKSTMTVNNATTFNWNGFQIDPTDPSGDTNIQAATINMRGMVITEPDQDKYQELLLNSSPRWDYLALECGGAAKFSENVYWRTASGIGSDTVADGESAMITLDPAYARTTTTGSKGLNITRHNYIKMEDVATSNLGGGSLSDSAVIWFDGDFSGGSQHSALEAGDSNFASVGNVAGFVKINVNGTLYKIPAYTIGAT